MEKLFSEETGTSATSTTSVLCSASVPEIGPANLAKAEEQRLIRECMNVCEAYAADSIPPEKRQQRCEKRAYKGGRTLEPHFLLQTDMDSKRKCAESRHNCVESVVSGRQIVRRRVKEKKEDVSEGDFTQVTPRA